MALLTVQSIDRTGITPSYGAVAASDTFVPGPNTFIHVKNASGTIDNVVVQTPGNVIPNVPIGDPTFSVPITTGDKMFGPIPGGVFADPSTGLVTVTHSQTASVTCAVFNLSSP